MSTKHTKSYTAVIERDLATGLYVGYIPGIAGAHSQAETVEELVVNLREVLDLVASERTAVVPESEFVGIQLVAV
jgi:predicted RNase H-like HicB family nuclease